MNGLNLGLHRAQLKVFKDPSQLRLMVSGRGVGKSVLLLTSAIAFCLGYREKIQGISPQVAAIVMPTMRQAIAIHWLPLLNILDKSPIVENIDRSRYRITFKGNRPDLILRGADREGERLRGLNLCWVGLDEYQSFSSPDIFDKVLMPALSRNKNWKALVIGTPLGRAQHLYHFRQRVLDTPNWGFYHFKTEDNPFISKRSIENARASLPPRVFAQEYEADFISFSNRLLPDLEDRHKAIALPSEFRSVFIGTDWGDQNPFITVAGITHTGDWYLIDRWRNDTCQPVAEEEIKAEVARLEREHNVYRCLLPDDRPATILAFRRYGKQHGLLGMQRSIQVMRNNPGPMERAEILNTLFYQDKLFLGPRCHDMFDEFTSYRRATDANGTALNKPMKKVGKSDSVDATAYLIGAIHPKTEYLSYRKPKEILQDSAIA